MAFSRARCPAPDAVSVCCRWTLESRYHQDEGQADRLGGETDVVVRGGKEESEEVGYLRITKEMKADIRKLFLGSV